MPFANKIFCIKTHDTDSGHVELHVLSSESSFQQLALHAVTSIESGESSNFDFGIANFLGNGCNDLVCIKRNNTQSGKVEVQVLSGLEDSYEALSFQSSTLIDLSQQNDFEFHLGHFGNFDKTSRPDLFCIKKANTGSGRLEVHVLSAAANYREFDLQIATPIIVEDARNFDVALGSYMQSSGTDLYLLKKTNTGSGNLEVHILSWLSSYQEFVLHKATPLNAVDADENFVFCMASRTFDEADATISAYSNLVCIKKSACSSGAVEIHDIGRFDDYGSFTFHGNSALSDVGASNFRFATRLSSICGEPPSVLYSGAFLRQGQQLTSSGGIFRLILQTDGNLVCYRSDLDKAVWSSGTSGHVVSKAIMQADGNFVILGDNNVVIWQTDTAGNPGAYLKIDDSGGFSIYSAADLLRWWSGAASANLIPSKPSLTFRGDRCDAFQQASDGSVLHNQFINAWSGWTSLGGQTVSGPASTSWAEDRLDVFALGNENSLMHKFVQEVAGPAGHVNYWSDWEDLGGSLLSAPSASSSGQGSIEIFARGRDNSVWHRKYDTNGWNAWESLGGVTFSQPVSVSPAPGLVDVFARGVDNGLWRKSFRDGSWRDWECIGDNVVGDLYATIADGSIRVAALLKGGILGVGALSDSGWLDWKTFALNVPDKGLMGSRDCDQAYGNCCHEADKIEDDLARDAAYIKCKLEQAYCYGKYAAMSAEQWIEHTMTSVINWITLNRGTIGIVLGIVTVVSAVVVTIVFPPAGAAIAVVFLA